MDTPPRAQPDTVNKSATLPFFELEPPPGIRVESYGISDIGRVRKANEDQFLIGQLKNALDVERTSLKQARTKWGRKQFGHLFIVADGVGGSVGGRHASALTIDTIEAVLVSVIDTCQHDSTDDEAILNGLSEAVELADYRVIKESHDRPELSGMGTTVTVAFLRESDLFLAHVGDSRCYLFRDGQLGQLTKDHTIADELAREGVLRQDEVEAHPMSNVITNVIGGTEKGARVEQTQKRVQQGDAILLCTDGLTKMVKDVEIAQILSEEATAKLACERLIELANNRGGKDNTTVIVAQVRNSGTEESAE